jgi:hypothetical protein
MKLSRQSGGGGWKGEHTLRGNANTRTGWEGSWGDGPDGEGWSWGGGALSFTVAPGTAPGNPHRLAFTDDGFIHGSFDGGLVITQNNPPLLLSSGSTYVSAAACSPHSTSNLSVVCDFQACTLTVCL